MSFNMSTNEIIDYLNDFIIGQDQAKKQITIAIRERIIKAANKNNPLFDDIQPKNILINGPSGSGKTEIARRLAKMMNSPFVKVELTTITQVGFQGAKLTSVFELLVEEAILVLEEEEFKKSKINRFFLNNLEKEVLTLIYNDCKNNEEFKQWAKLEDFLEAFCFKDFDKKIPMPLKFAPYIFELLSPANMDKPTEDSTKEEIEKFNEEYDSLETLEDLDKALLEKGKIKIISNLICYIPGLTPQFQFPEHIKWFKKNASELLNFSSNLNQASVTNYLMNLDNDDINKIYDYLINNISCSFMETFIYVKNRNKKRQVITKKRIKNLIEERAIIFLDEFDKLFVSKNKDNVGQMGVVRDLLPYLDGCDVFVNHKDYGKIKFHTQNILFIAAGAFHESMASIEDISPEISGRLSIRVELNALSESDLKNILVKKHGGLINQSQLILAQEGLDIDFDESAIDALAKLTWDLNQKGEDLGARRLRAVCSFIFGDIQINVDQYKPKFTLNKSDVEKYRESMMRLAGREKKHAYEKTKGKNLFGF